MCVVFAHVGGALASVYTCRGPRSLSDGFPFLSTIYCFETVFHYPQNSLFWGASPWNLPYPTPRTGLQMCTVSNSYVDVGGLIAGSHDYAGSTLPTEQSSQPLFYSVI